jgi:RimJ/RimL family protein N-acetyltransferase
MEIKPVVLTGRHVRLEPMTEAHVPGLAAIGLHDDIWRWMPYGFIRSEAGIRGWVQSLLKHADQGTDLPFVVIHLASGRVAGATRYMDIHPEHRGLEIGGTWYGLEFQRTAVNTECKFLLMQYAFETLGCIRVQLKTDLGNERSQKAIERIGAVKEGVLRNHMIMPDGRYRHSVFYSVLDTEWPAVKDRLARVIDR